jgi:hypothetical protein
MNQNNQAIFQQAIEDDYSNDQTLLISSALIFNVFIMLFVGLYWMNPLLHEFISGRPLL